MLVYEGHDAAKTSSCPNPKRVDQPGSYRGGRPTQNGLFVEAARRYKCGQDRAERVLVFEKIRPGIWAYNGLFILTDAWTEESKGRLVFKFRLVLTDDGEERVTAQVVGADNDRLIPSAVKLAVWKRDKGKCVICGTQSNLHFDHIIPYSRGGSSKDPENIQILCAKHNLKKHDRIM